MNIVEVRDMNEMNKIILATLNSSFCGVFGGDRDILTRFVESHIDTYEKLRVASERIFGFSSGIPMPSSHFFFEPYNDHINYYIAAGLADKSIKDHYRSLKRNIEIAKEEKDPEVLTMNDLDAAFVICFIPAVFGLIAFAGEFCYARHIKRKQAEDKASKNSKRKKIAKDLES